MMRPLVVCALFLNMAGFTQAVRTVVFIHGMTDDYKTFDHFKRYLRKDFPGINLISLNAFNNMASITPLSRQIPVFSGLLSRIIKQHGPVTLIGHSQGGFIARAILQMTGNPKIHTLISLGAPAAGSFGLPGSAGPHDPFGRQMRAMVSKICYGISVSSEEKKHIRRILKKRYDNEWFMMFDRALSGHQISACDIWRDPTPEFYSMYLKNNKILPYINNEIPHKNSENYKNNFLKVTKMVLAGTQIDKTVVPWQSSQYSFYNKAMKVVKMRDNFLYKEDKFGLKTLDKRNGLVTCTVDNVVHNRLQKEHSVYTKCVKPHIESQFVTPTSYSTETAKDS